jgi:hypothetical protein
LTLTTTQSPHQIVFIRLKMMERGTQSRRHDSVE